MSSQTYKDQNVLIAISKYGAKYSAKYSGVILDAQGDAAISEVEESVFIEDHSMLSYEEIKTFSGLTPGYWIWEGDIWVDDGQSPMGEPSDPDVRWYGKFRPARPLEVWKRMQS